jgi:RND family efflux transporter MFP subunit
MMIMFNSEFESTSKSNANFNSNSRFKSFRRGRANSSQRGRVQLMARSGLLALCGLVASSWLSAAEVALPTTCLIEPYARIAVRSPVTAIIGTMAVDRGSVIRKGQILVTLDAAVERAAWVSAQERASMQSSTRAAQARSELAQQRLSRRDELVRVGFVSGQDHDEALAELGVSAAALAEAAENRRLAQLEAQRLSAEVQRRTIRSPVSGVVTDRLQHPGELASSGDGATPILRLAQTDPLRVELVLPAARAGSVRVGDIVNVRPEAPASARYRARVAVVDSVVDAASGTFGVRLEIANPKHEILAGVKCTAEL